MNRKERKEKADSKRRTFKSIATMVILETASEVSKTSNISYGSAFKIVLLNKEELTAEWVKKEPENAHFIRPAMNLAIKDILEEIKKRKENKINKANWK